MTIAGIVLAGGQSSRFGKPKMFELYKGKCFYEYSIDALQGLSPIVISTNRQFSASFKTSKDILLLEDEHDYQGPLHALYNIFSKMPHIEWFFVLTCDVPFITSQFICELLSYIKGSVSDAIVPIESKTMQPLLALYHRRCLPQFKTILLQNKKSMKALLDTINVQIVPFTTQKMFTNINSQEEWQNHKFC